MSERAASGESSIHRDEAGRWHGYVSMGLKREGARDRRHVSGKTRAVVVGKVRALEQQRDAGVALTAGQSLTVAAWLEHWVETIAARKVRPSTLEGYRSRIRLYMVPALGHHRLDRLQPEHLEAFYGELSDQHLSTSTVLQVHRILSRALKVAVQRGRVGRNVCQLVDAPSLQHYEVEPLTAAEARALLTAAAGTPNGARWSVALALGLRQGEALGLWWDDIDLEAGTLRVRRALQRRKGEGLVFVEPKSRAGRRTILLPAPLIHALKVHKSRQLQDRVRAANLWQGEHPLVFAQANGRPINPATDWKAWKALLTTAGVRDARLHDARHTAATLLLQQGVPARVAMQVLGHSQIGLTLGTYSHVVPELAQEAASRMAAVLWDDSGAPEATKLAPRRSGGAAS
ncbi:MAG: Integrase [Frankiales bacterium]|nr:Integrase [Frankiales bacterium]